MKVAVFFTGRKRPGFDPDWAAFLVKEIRSQMQASPFDTLFFENIADEKAMRAALDASRKAGVSVVIISQPTMGDGNLWPILLSDWGGAVILWATPENPDNPKVSACGLVGAHNWCSGMSQAGSPPYLVYGKPGEKKTVLELEQAIHAAAAMIKLQHSRIGLIGDHAPGFLNMACDAAMLQKLLGARLKRFGLHEFISQARSFSDAEVAEDRRKVDALKIPVREGVTVSNESLDISSRYYLAVKKLIEEESLDMVAIRCWPELPNDPGVWPYLAIARLAEDGVSICEEGDIDGAIGCQLAQSFGCEMAAFNSDWLEHDDDSILLWHAGATPFGMCESIGSPDGPKLSVHFNTGKPLIVDTLIRVNMPVTLFRLWRMKDRYQLAICEGRIAKPPRKVDGCAGTVQVSGGGVEKFFKDACRKGMPHHVTVMKGHYAEQLNLWAQQYLPQPIEVVLQCGGGQ